MAGLAMETSKAEPADRNQAKARLNRDAYVDSFPYVESYVDRYAYVEVQLYLLSNYKRSWRRWIQQYQYSTVVTSSKLIEDFSSRDVIKSWTAVRCIRSDTVTQSGMKL
ncbi:pre-mRNA-processing factor 39 [Dorcoceras hygrometricum]|uniref:Pre-mRNA-processing factor 39 n=1 Tax=Dorcoceras hygrometricum TaxID=472368 RepID=A0A2Z7CZS7_9LAMI|nr:pre-mRNA-processing factor 39 [Dorcoceras hygrometricum]